MTQFRVYSIYSCHRYVYKGCVSPRNITWLDEEDQARKTYRSFRIAWHCAANLSTGRSCGMSVTVCRQKCHPLEPYVTVSYFPWSLCFLLAPLHHSAFFPWCQPSPFWPFSPRVWIQIYGRFLPASAWDCWASRIHSPASLPGLQSQLLRFSTAHHKSQLLHQLLWFPPCLCLLFSKFPEAKLKTTPDPLRAAITRY